MKLKLTTAYNLKANGKNERGLRSIVVKACRGKPKHWPRLLPFALWIDRATHSIITGYMPSELMLDHRLIMLVEDYVPT